MNIQSRWQQIDEVVAAALELPREQRNAYVDSACGAGTALSTEVRALIRAYEEAGDFLNPVTYARKWSAIETESGNLDGRHAGPYRLIHIIGRGGMGTVYLGRRADEQFEKDVAVKLINPAFYSPSVMRRFQHERRILATLEHPHIARLLDAGLTSDGIPFIVMEFVAGEPVHEFCRKRNLSVRERLALFLKICEAVQFAHRNLIVHRDLKPSNILVTEDGTPKLLDFGIAKILSISPTDTTATAPLTQAMTPDYASPEQLRGVNVNTATDVYSLGVLLFELLAGHRPYVLSGKPLDEIIRVVCEEEPPRMAAPECAGDLEHIVAKAIRKDPAERYASVEHFAADIERYLRGFPVQARRPSLAYIAGKYVRRHKAVFVLGAIALLLGIAGVAAIVRQANIAQRRFDQVRQLAHSIVFELHDGVAPLPGSLPVRKLLVTRALEYLNGLARESQNDRGLTVELAEAFIRIGEVQGGVSSGSFGDYPAALASFEKARDLLLAVKAVDAEVQNLTGTAYYRLAGVNVNLRRYPQAIENDGLAEKMYAAVLQQNPKDEKAMRGLANAYFAHAVTLGRMGGDGLSEYWQKCLDIYRTLIDRKSSEPNLARDYARTLTFYGSRLMNAGRYEDALRAVEQSRAINESRIADKAEDAAALTDLSMSHGIASETFEKMQRFEQALAAGQKAQSILQSLSDADPQDVYLKNELAGRQLTTGTQLMKLNRVAEAAGAFRDVIKIGEDLTSRQPPVGFSREFLAASWLHLGQVETKSGRRSEGCAAFIKSVREYGETQKAGALRPPDQQLSEEAAKSAAACASPGN
ncbi:MAG TPA: serine/threonine-protein kinase [Terriglobia bacterium]|nr:serine/threonine-protein kinase [Terriglobia bacterium]